MKFAAALFTVDLPRFLSWAIIDQGKEQGGGRGGGRGEDTVLSHGTWRLYDTSVQTAVQSYARISSSVSIIHFRTKTHVFVSPPTRGSVNGQAWCHTYALLSLMLRRVSVLPRDVSRKSFNPTPYHVFMDMDSQGTTNDVTQVYLVNVLE